MDESPAGASTVELSEDAPSAGELSADAPSVDELSADAPSVDELSADAPSVEKPPSSVPPSAIMARQAMGSGVATHEQSTPGGYWLAGSGP